MNTTKHNRYEVQSWGSDKIETYWCYLYVAGDYGITKNRLRDLTFPSGMCVTIEKLEYVYAAGVEDGFRIGIIQYPPFPENEDDIFRKIKSVGYAIAELNYQWSFTIVTPDKTYFYSRRKK